MFGGHGGVDLPKYMYHTAEEARAVAEKMGLDDVHSAQHKGEKVWKPGATEAELQKAVRGGSMMGGANQTLDEIDEEFYGNTGGNGGMF